VANYVAQEFEIGVHMWSTGLAGGSGEPNLSFNNYTPASIAADFNKQRTSFASLFPAAVPLRTNHNPCIV